jgi:uncharacterized protein (PEP-CTERM system associated)
MAIITQVSRTAGEEAEEAQKVKTNITIPAILIGTFMFLDCWAFDSPKPSFLSNVQFAPQIDIRGVYTDNLFLTEANEKSDFVGVVTPGINIIGNGSRASFDLTYRIQGLLYASESDLNDVYQQVAGAGNVEVFENHLFLDMNGSFGQQNVANFGARNRDNIAGGGNRRDVAVYTVSPYWLQRFGNWADAEIRFSHNDVKVDNQGGNDSTEDQFLTIVTSGTRFARLTWEFYAESTDISFDQGSDAQFREITGEVSYQLNSRFALLGKLGYEDNDFASVQNTDLSGEVWSIGTRWTPSARTQLELRYGDRFFGSEVFLDFRHISRRATWIANYRKEPELARNQLLRRGPFVVADGIGDTIVDPVTGDPLPIDGALATINDEVFIRQVFSAGVDIQGKRTFLQLRGYSESRDYSITQRQEDVNGMFANATRALNRTTNLVASFDWSQGESNQIDSFDDYEGYLGAVRQLSTKLSVAAGYNFRQRNSNRANNDFTENRFTLSALIAF